MSFVSDIKSKFDRSNTVIRLIILNVGLFAMQTIFFLIFYLVGLQEPFEKFYNTNFALSFFPKEFATHPWTVITYMFLHNPDELLHILGNMLFLFFFGKILIDFHPQKNIVPLYVFGGIVGAAVAFIAILFMQTPAHYMIGASAAVMAIVFATVTLVPNYTVLLPLLGPVKLKYIALVVLILDLISIPQQDNIGGHFAHLGGALAGFFYIHQYRKGKYYFEFWFRVENWISNLRKPKMKVVSHKMKSTPDSKKNTVNPEQQKILDEILDKIHASGYESLSAKEKDFLFTMSNSKK